MDSVQRVLVADDDEDIRFVLQVALVDAGYSVLAVNDGAAVLDVLRDEPSGWILLLDWMMPQLDGHETLRAIAANPVLAESNAFILMTAGGRTLPLAFVQLLAALDVAYLAKPFDLDALFAAITAASQQLNTQQ
jgi:CheY-like chemotaxis protein